MKYQNLAVNLWKDAIRDVTSLGSTFFAGMVIIVLFIVDKNKAFQLLLGIILVEASGSIIKFFFFKKRPNQQSFSNFLEKIDAGSFPSIHTARFVVVALLVNSLFNSVISSLIALILIGLVAMSRILLKKHYFTDVAGGFILGFIIWFLSEKIF